MGRRDVDPLPPIEVVGAEPDLSSTQHVAVGPRSPRGRGRTALAGAGALAGALLLGLSLGGDDDAPGGAAREERDNRERAALKTTTTSGRSSTTGRPTTTTTIVEGPVFGEALEGWLLVFGDGEWWSVDLATGARVELEASIDNPYDARSVRGGMVMVTAAPGPAGTTAAVYYDLRPDGADPVVLGSASQVMVGGNPDEVWLIDGSFESNPPGPTSEATLVDLTGARLRSFEVPSPYVTGAVDEGVVIARGGRSYVVDEDGTHPLGTGEVLGTTADAVVAFACDDRAACALELQPISGRSPVVLSAVGGRVDLGFAAIAGPEGRIAVLHYPGDVGGGEISLFDASGRLLGTGSMPSLQGEPRWLPGELGLVSPSGGGVEWIHPDGDGWDDVGGPDAGRARG